MKLFKRNKKNSYILSEKDKRWNRFIEDVFLEIYPHYPKFKGKL